MKISINEIPSQGFDLEEASSGQELELERADIKYIEPVIVKAQVSTDRDNIIIALQATSRMQLTCNRCLETFEQDIQKQIKLVKSAAEESVIDLTQIIREEILLEYPVKFLCVDSCKGLCASCGRNLNGKKCNCSRDAEPFRGLPLNLADENN